ncbi:hypothetical protein L249_3630 [Ophiocordyceps polyrhachis-furcata BCC 54312]|uniref:Uncharacterized protein n=1 Tax=Ophiocordyceps polyrhachis-furcata BCC 54312 TaxID=1330021 RepID=A0A367LMF1_9HYPO|nr:hypothetical protein L249_3630 [Ophiocordyceps polyrhachis-furcata BCC 54312]
MASSSSSTSSSPSPSQSPPPPPPYPFASAPDIVRSHQKDSYFSGQVSNRLTDLWRLTRGARAAHARGPELRCLGALLYLGLTTAATEVAMEVAVMEAATTAATMAATMVAMAAMAAATLDNPRGSRRAG